VRDQDRELHILGWNVRGMARNQIDRFLNAVSNVIKWDVLLLQEFGNGCGDQCTNFLTKEDNHRVFVSPRVKGMRSLAIIVNRSIAAAVLEEPECRGRAMSLGLHFQTGVLEVGSIHLCPDHNLEHYEQSLEDARELMDLHEGRAWYWAADLQTCLGASESAEDADILGSFAVGPRDTDGRAEEVMSFLHEMNLGAVNSFHELASGYTCHYDMKYPSKQIDYGLCSLSILSRISSCRLIRGDLELATDTDHTAHKTILHLGDFRPNKQSGDRILNKSKPLRWKKTDNDFGYRVQRCLEGDASTVRRLKPDIDVYIASAENFSEDRCCSVGWGAVVFHSSDEEVPVAMTSGNVVPFEWHQHYLGANVATALTAQMTALCETVLMLLVGTQEDVMREAIDTWRVLPAVRIHVESEEVVDIALGRRKIQSHWKLSRMLFHLTTKLRNARQVWIDHTDKFRGAVGFDFASSLAFGGTLMHEYARIRSGKLEIPLSRPQVNIDRFLSRVREDVGNPGFRPEVCSLSRISEVISAEADICGRPSRTKSSFKLPEDHEILCEVRELERLRRNSVCRIEKYHISKALLKFYRRIHQIEKNESLKTQIESKVSFKSAKPRPVVPSLLVTDTADPTGKTEISVSEPEDMSEALTKFFQDLFTSRFSADLPSWIYDEWAPEDPECACLKFLTALLIREEAAAMAGGKSCCASDRLVAEMLKELDEDTFELLAEAFKRRILNRSGPEDEKLWSLHEVQLIMKVTNAKRAREFRPIAVLSVLYKLYSRVLARLAELNKIPIRSSQFAFRRHHSAEEVLATIRFAVERAVEWQEPLYLVDGDIEKAYDSTEHPVAVNSLVTAGVARPLVGAWFREIRNTKSIFILDNRVSSRTVSRTRSLIQGDPSAPGKFNVILDVSVCEKFLHKAHQEGWGISLDDGQENLSLILFADNYWLIGKNPSETQAMTEFWLECLAAAGFRTPLEEISWMTTLQDDVPAGIIVRGEVLKRVSRAAGLKILGAMVTADNRNTVEVKQRVCKAWRVYGAISDHLRCSRGSLKLRLKLLDTHVLPSLLWGGGSWNLTNQDLAKITKLQNTMVRRILRVPKMENESLAEYVFRTNHLIKKTIARFSTPWTDQYHKKVYHLAGHLARMSKWAPSRISFRVFRFRNYEYIKHVQAVHGNQRHCRRFRVWRWERPIWKFFGAQWWEHASDVADWNARWHSYISWRRENR